MRLALVIGIDAEVLSVSYLKEQMDKLSYDVRLQEFNTRRKALSEVDMKEHLQSLPDLTDMAVKIDIKDLNKDKANDKAGASERPQD